MSAWREMVAEHVALELLEAQDRVRDLEADRDAYRELAQAAIHALHHGATC